MHPCMHKNVGEPCAVASRNEVGGTGWEDDPGGAVMAALRVT